MKAIYYPPCRKCGATHGMGIENMETGEIEPIDLCKDCLFYSEPKEMPDLQEQLNEISRMLNENRI
jgi:hypothetical protein